MVVQDRATVTPHRYGEWGCPGKGKLVGICRLSASHTAPTNENLTILTDQALLCVPRGVSNRITIPGVQFHARKTRL